MHKSVSIFENQKFMVEFFDKDIDGLYSDGTFKRPKRLFAQVNNLKLILGPWSKSVTWTIVIKFLIKSQIFT